jgi:protein TonB
LLLASPALAQPAADAIPDIDSANPPPGIEAPKELAPHAVSAADYPAVSVRLQETGRTSLRYMILDDGGIGAIEILQSSGSPRLDDASIAMVQSRWRFVPAMRNGAPIRVWQHATIAWQLAPQAPLANR